MDTKLSITTFTLFLFLASYVSAQTNGFDVTKYGALPNRDITKALTNAWKDACGSTTPSKVVVPKGTYMLKQIDLKGPCKAPINVQVDGKILAPKNPKLLNGVDQWVKFGYINFFTLSERGTFDGQGETAWKHNDCGTNKNCDRLSMNFGFAFLNNSIIQDITSKDSKNFHVNVLGCNNLTFINMNINAPATSLNTDGIHIGRSTQVVITNSIIGTGDDCISLGDGSKQITILNVTCGPGHGISVGSLGKYPNEEPVEGLTVKNCTLKNTDNGLRIKTWPGTPIISSVSKMHFEDIVMVNVSNPILIDQQYCPWNQCTKQYPSKIKITDVSFKNIRGTSATQEGIVLDCSSSVPCEFVELNDIDLTFNGAVTTAKFSNTKPTIIGKRSFTLVQSSIDISCHRPVQSSSSHLLLRSSSSRLLRVPAFKNWMIDFLQSAGRSTYAFGITLLLGSIPSSYVSAQTNGFDVTKYGALPNRDITKALTNAWKDACGSTTPSKVVVPKGTYMLKQIDLKGPCKAPINVQVDGKILAPKNPKLLNGVDQWVKFGYINFFTLSGRGTFDGQGETAWKHNDCGTNKNCDRLSMNFGFAFLNNSIIQDITSKDSKNFHVNVLGCNNLTFINMNINAPATSLNTDGIHIGRSTQVVITNSIIGTGDDCISLGDGSKQITILNVTCGPGHGISVGSLGKYPNEEPVEGLTVKNCTLKNTDNGLRIKTWPGTPIISSVSKMHFEDIVMVNVSNPILIDQQYCPWNQCTKQYPSKIKITDVSFKNIRGTSATQEGIVLDCSSSVPCEFVELNDIDLTFNGAVTTAKFSNTKPTIIGKVPKLMA
ncbi:hypothetical protein Lal_00002629 [Lupinus albus]|nr:hypothetical protein Lal_00002629 [Lupinus albus]